MVDYQSHGYLAGLFVLFVFGVFLFQTRAIWRASLVGFVGDRGATWGYVFVWIAYFYGLINSIGYLSLKNPTGFFAFAQSLAQAIGAFMMPLNMTIHIVIVAYAILLLNRTFTKP